MQANRKMSSNANLPKPKEETAPSLFRKQDRIQASGWNSHCFISTHLCWWISFFSNFDVLWQHLLKRLRKQTKYFCCLPVTIWPVNPVGVSQRALETKNEKKKGWFLSICCSNPRCHVHQSYAAMNASTLHHDWHLSTHISIAIRAQKEHLWKLKGINSKTCVHFTAVVVNLSKCSCKNICSHE